MTICLFLKKKTLWMFGLMGLKLIVKYANIIVIVAVFPDNH